VVGSSTASVTRAKTLVVGGETVTDAPVMTIPGDSQLDHISQEIDPSGATQIDGFLGGSFLRNFLVTIDYPKRQLHLQRYANETWRDEFQRVGITLESGPTSTQYVVGSIYPGSDAESKGVMVNDEILAIGGTQLDTLTPITLETSVEADNLLDGTPGTTLAITFGTAMSSAIANQTVERIGSGRRSRWRRSATGTNRSPTRSGFRRRRWRCCSRGRVRRPASVRASSWCAPSSAAWRPAHDPLTCTPRDARSAPA
jgi:hypothetical protein